MVQWLEHLCTIKQQMPVSKLMQTQTDERTFLNDLELNAYCMGLDTRQTLNLISAGDMIRAAVDHANRDKLPGQRDQS